ncbi:uncharacterized protein LOC134262706 [Saccostrea cucullata]|uniref:uncharacterized protein LOC134262706 n=1 Tax=Saccostrea cuccullata TaxID=36930 RepID=UPI002ED2E0B0
MIEKIIGKSIYDCVRSPCIDPDYADAVRLVNYAEPCLKIFPIINFTLDTSMDLLCRSAVGISNCVLATVTEETDSTCLSKDKVLIANNFMNLIPRPFRTRIRFCIKNNYTEFYSADIENAIQDSTGNISQTLIFLLVGLAFFLLFVAILAISLVKMRAMLLKKRRKELMRLPSVPKAGTPQYESTFVISEGPYLDPDYDVIEEMDEGYERLPEPNIENTEQEESNIERTYTLPTNPEGTYLDVVHVKKNVTDYINIHPYTELVNDSEDHRSTVDDQLFHRGNRESPEKLATITAPDVENQ